MAAAQHPNGLLQWSNAAADPRVDTFDNEGFLDLMERYFAQVRVGRCECGTRGLAADPRFTRACSLVCAASGRFHGLPACTLVSDRRWLAVSLQPLEKKMADVRPELAYQVCLAAVCSSAQPLICPAKYTASCWQLVAICCAVQVCRARLKASGYPPIIMPAHVVTRPFHRQVGATPEGVEKPRCLRDAKLRELAAGMAPEHAPTIPTGADVKVCGSGRVDGQVDAML